MLDMILKDAGKAIGEETGDALYAELNESGGVSFEVTVADGTFSVEFIRI